MGGAVDETFTAAAAGAMIGTFRLVVKNAVVFYQFLNLVEENGSLALRLKHFNADLTGWEEKDRFLTFRRTGADRLQIFLAHDPRTEPSGKPCSI